MAESQRAFHLKELANSLVNTGVRFMRCYFLRDGQIAGVEMLADLSDQNAIARARLLFSERKGSFVGFEVWDNARMIFSYAAPERLRHGSQNDCPGTRVSLGEVRASFRTRGNP